MPEAGAGDRFISHRQVAAIITIGLFKWAD